MRLSGMKWLMRILWSLGLAVFLAGCSSTKYVPEGRFLLDDVKVYTADEEAKVGDLTSYLRQRPNAKWFSLFKVPLYVYGWSGRDTTKWLNRMWRRVGDAPVIYDEELSAQGQREMEKALQNMGYLHGRIVRQEERKGKKIRLRYRVEPGEPVRKGDDDFTPYEMIALVKGILENRVSVYGDELVPLVCAELGVSRPSDKLAEFIGECVALGVERGVFVRSISDRISLC